MYVRCYSHKSFSTCSSFRKHLHQACLFCRFSDIYKDSDYNEVYSRVAKTYSSHFADNVFSHFITIEDFIDAM